MKSRSVGEGRSSWFDLAWVTTVVGVMAVLFVSPTPAFASCSNRQTTWDGSRLDPSSYVGRLQGTQSDMLVRNFSICGGTSSPNDNLGSFWVAMDDPIQTFGILQSGYEKYDDAFGNGTLEFFMEYIKNATCDKGQSSCFQIAFSTHYSIVGTITNDMYYRFRTVRFSGDGKVRMEVCQAGTTDCDVPLVGPDPYGDWGWVNAHAYSEVTAETHDTNTDMPGTLTDPAQGNNIQSSIASTWTTINYTHYTDPSDSTYPSNYHFSWVNNPPKDHLEVWSS